MTRPTARAIASALALVLCAPSLAAAQRLTLSVAPRVVTFPSSDPDTVPLVTAAPVQVSYRVQQNAGGTWLLTIRAEGDLLAGGSTVDISNITWLGTPAPPLQNGTLSATVEQTLAAGSGNANPTQIGSITFRLAN